MVAHLLNRSFKNSIAFFLLWLFSVVWPCVLNVVCLSVGMILMIVYHFVGFVLYGFFQFQDWVSVAVRGAWTF